MRYSPLFISAVASLALLSASHAASVTLAGSITGLPGANNDQIDGWRSTNFLKNFDPDGDNIYGTAGYVLYGTDAAVNSTAGSVQTADPLTFNNGVIRTLNSVPGYLTLANSLNGQNQLASSYGYKLFDDPTQPTGPTVSDVESGAALRGGVALGTESPLLNITIGTGFPTAGLRIGLIYDNTDNYAGYFRLTQTTGGGATSTFTFGVVPAGQELGLAFFDLSGVVQGDVFTLYGAKDGPTQPTGGNSNTNVIYGGLSFDVVPEPTSAGLLLLGGALIGMKRRQRLL